MGHRAALLGGSQGGSGTMMLSFGAGKSVLHHTTDRTRATIGGRLAPPKYSGPSLPATAGIRGPRRSALRLSAMPGQRQAETEKRKMEEYNKDMQRQMRNPYEYHHDLGMHFTRIAHNLIVGSQPQSAQDIDRLKDELGVTAVLNLQQDADIEYWGIHLPSIVRRCRDLGIRHVRRPARDFDPDSLRKELPGAASALEREISQGGVVYVHCTAGLGRAPAVAIAYLFWFTSDMDVCEHPPCHSLDFINDLSDCKVWVVVQLNGAYRAVTSKRPCGPKRDAIRGATYDLAKNDPRQQPFEDLPDHAFTGVADWERTLIQQRVRGLRGTQDALFAN